MKKLVLTILLAVALTPCASKADDYKLLTPLPCIQGVGTCTPGTMQDHIDISTYILYVYKFGIALAVFLAIIMIIWGGFEYITSEVPFIKSDGKGKIENAVFGLVMVLISYLVLATIDPRLVNIDAKIEPIKVDTSGANSVNTLLNDLGNQLRASNIDAQKQIAQMHDDINSQAQKKSDLESKIAAGDTSDATKTALEKAKVDLIKTQVDGVSFTTNNEGVGYFGTAAGLIGEPVATAARNISGAGDYTPTQIIAKLPDYIVGTNLEQYTAVPVADPTDGQPYPTNVPNVIQSDYNLRINQIKKLDPTGANSANTVQDLLSQRDFYIGQVKEEIDLQVKSAWALKMNSLSINNSLVNDTIADLKKSLAIYQESASNAEQEVIGLGIDPSKYAKIYQTRVDSINLTLSQLKPK